MDAVCVVCDWAGGIQEQYRRAVCEREKKCNRKQRAACTQSLEEGDTQEHRGESQRVPLGWCLERNVDMGFAQSLRTLRRETKELG